MSGIRTPNIEKSTEKHVLIGISMGTCGKKENKMRKKIMGKYNFYINIVESGIKHHSPNTNIIFNNVYHNEHFKINEKLSRL
jgi:hypothetical protein